MMGSWTQQLLLVMAGGALGAAGRFWLGGALLRQFGSGIPWGTLAANLLGAYFIGLCVGVLQALPQLDPVWRVALITGFLGALTTFSSFSIEVVEQLQQQRYALALGTTGLHLGGSLLLTFLGLQSAALVLAAQR